MRGIEQRKKLMAFLLKHGPVGVMSSEVTKYLMTLGYTDRSASSTLLNAERHGIIFGKRKTDPVYLKRIRYFAQKDWCDSCPEGVLDEAKRKEDLRLANLLKLERRKVKRALIKEAAPIKKARAKEVAAIVIKKQNTTLVGAAIIPAGVKVTHCPGYQGDYRIQVAPSYVGEFTREWQQLRAA